MAIKKKPKKQLTMAQREKLLLTPCRTRGEFMNWIKYHFRVPLPDFTVSRYADTNPFDAAWEVYNICVNKKNPEKISALLFVAGRGSGKTLGMAIAELAILLHDRRDVVHVGAILGQAKRCYDYQKKFMLNAQLKPILNRDRVDPFGDSYKMLEKMNMEKSIFKMGPYDETTLEILPCTLKAVNGPHVPLVVVDEIDTVDGEGHKAFKDIGGMLDSRGDQIGLRVGISTRKSRYGLMNQQIEDAEKQGRTVRRWTAFEFSQRCPDEKSGTDVSVGYVNQDKMITLTKEQYDLKDKQARKEFVEYEFPGSKCLKCPIASVCLGDAKKQQCTSPWLTPIQDIIDKALENGPDWTLAQLMNLKPSVEGIIYKEFEERLHVQDWNQLWEILTGKEYPGECTHDIFVKKCHSMNLPCYAGIDWGWKNPSTVVFFFVDGRENVYVVNCQGRTQTNNPTWCQIIKNKWHNMYRCQLYYPDLANPGDGVTMKQEGLPCPAKVEKNVESGIQVVKKFLRSLASPNPKLYFAKENCAPIVQEFNMYHFKTDAAGNVTDDPEKEHDHWLDALRYALYGLFGSSTLITSTMGVDYEVEKITNARGEFTRNPSAEEFAISQGIQFNANYDDDKAKIGKLGTANELDEEDDTINGDGGFLWSFN